MHPIDRLGSTLLHFLWQGAAITALYAVLRAPARRATPNFRYLLACAALAAMMAAPLLTWMDLAPSSAPMTPAAAARWAVATPYSPTDPIHIVSPVPVPVPYLPWVVAVWLAGAAALSLRLIGGCVIALRLRTRRVLPAPVEWQFALDRLRARLRVSAPVRLLVSAVAEVPTVVGWLRPVVLVPAGALAGLPPAQLEALLLHELAHIRRHDYLVNLLQSVAETLLFYHPCVWWISAHLRTEREHACDDLAVAVTGDVLTYARALSDLATARTYRSTPALAATGGSLAARIARLLGRPRAASRPAPAAIATVLALALAAAALFAQSADRPKFDVAAIKPAESRGMMFVRPLPGGRLTVNAPVRLILMNAYSLQFSQVIGAPDWLSSEPYAIEAKADGNPTREQLMLMLQTLLEDRFQLKAHRESRELPIYALTVAKNGPKLPAPKDGGCTVPGTPPTDAALPPCGQVRIAMSPAGVVMQGGRATMSELARVLAIPLSRPVVNRTSLAGNFDIRLQFTDDGPGATPPPPDAVNPTIFTAIQEQLGLRLEATKGSVEVLVIDHIERPTAN